MCVIWGVPYLMIRVAVRELAPVTLVFLRTAIGAALLVPFAAWRSELRPLVARWWPLLAYTVIEVVFPWVLLARAETKLTSSLTGLLIAAVPLVGAVVVAVTGSRERQGSAPLARAARRHRRRRGARRARRRSGAMSLAVAEVGGVAVCYAIGPIILSRRLSDVPALGVVAASLVIATLAVRAVRRVPLAGVDAVGARASSRCSASPSCAPPSRSSSSSR